jgi:hypothetical protein
MRDIGKCSKGRRRGIGSNSCIVAREGFELFDLFIAVAYQRSAPSLHPI